MQSETAQNESPTIAAIAAALAKAQGAMDAAKKDSENPHFRSKYADLASIWAACRGPLSANGLAVMQRVRTEGNGVTLETMLVHASGEWVRDTCHFPVAQQTPQAYGSAITYARRYSLAALVGVAADEDDDGNAASGRGNWEHPTSKPRPPPAKAAPPKPAPSPPPVAAPAAETKPPAAPAKDPATAAFHAANVETCAATGHEYDLKTGVCDGCGAKMPTPTTSKQSPELRARAVRVWKAAQAKGMALEAFQGWSTTILGRATPSSEWTTEDVDRLDVASQEPPAREPGAEG